MKTKKRRKKNETKNITENLHLVLKTPNVEINSKEKFHLIIYNVFPVCH